MYTLPTTILTCSLACIVGFKNFQIMGLILGLYLLARASYWKKQDVPIPVIVGILVITCAGIAIASPIPENNIKMKTEEVDCLEWKDCIEICDSTIENFLLPTTETPTTDTTHADCVVICEPELDTKKNKCYLPFMILNAIKPELVGNYTLYNQKFMGQLKRFMLSDNPVEALEIAMSRMSGNIMEIRKILNVLDSYFTEIEKNKDCARLLDMWFGYRIIKLANLM